MRIALCDCAVYSVTVWLWWLFSSVNSHYIYPWNFSWKKMTTGNPQTSLSSVTALLLKCGAHIDFWTPWVQKVVISQSGQIVLSTSTDMSQSLLFWCQHWNLLRDVILSCWCHFLEQVCGLLKSRGYYLILGVFFFFLNLPVGFQNHVETCSWAHMLILKTVRWVRFSWSCQKHYWYILK